MFENMVKDLIAMGERGVSFVVGPFQFFGYVLRSGHGDFFRSEKPEALIPSAWSEVFVRKNTVQPHDYSVEL